MLGKLGDDGCGFWALGCFLGRAQHRRALPLSFLGGACVTQLHLFGVGKAEMFGDASNYALVTHSFSRENVWEAVNIVIITFQ